MSEAMPMTEILPTWLPKHDLNKDNTKRHDKVEGEAHEVPTLDKELQTTKELRVSPKSIFIQLTLYILSRL